MIRVFRVLRILGPFGVFRAFRVLVCCATLMYGGHFQRSLSKDPFQLVGMSPTKWAPGVPQKTDTGHRGAGEPWTQQTLDPLNPKP